jgi:phosphatidate cytidylyltransferase
VLRKRVITSLIAIPVLISLIHWGSEAIFLAVIMLSVGFALIELNKINSHQHLFAHALVIAVGLASVVAINYYQDYVSFNSCGKKSWLITWLLTLTTITIFSLLLIQFIVYPKKVFLLHKPLFVILGILYVSMFLSYLILIRGSADGKKWLLFTLFVVWCGDCGAYFMGSIKGKHKLCPTTSPHKTVEGAVGGIIASVVAALIARIWFLEQLSITHGIALALGIATIGQLGDLCESTLKRIHGVKDSGTLLPGHGGMLDRIDSLLFTAPLVYYYKTLML